MVKGRKTERGWFGIMTTSGFQCGLAEGEIQPLGSGVIQEIPLSLGKEPLYNSGSMKRVQKAPCKHALCRGFPS